MTDGLPIVVVCGGGAGGLDLCARLMRRRVFHVILVDRQPTHLWKPLLHEVAAGTLDVGAHEISYFGLARQHRFIFHQGSLTNIDPSKRSITVSEVRTPDGAQLMPERVLSYDALVLAVGGQTEFFRVPGAQKHAVPMDSVQDAEGIRAKILTACTAANYRSGLTPPRFDIVIVGGGATGVELAAELRTATRTLASYGLHDLDPDIFLKLTLINADRQLLPQIKIEISGAIEHTLQELKVEVVNGDGVVEVLADAVRTMSGRQIRSDLTIWAAGVRGSGLSLPAGLHQNQQGLIIVDRHLRTHDPRIFAIGDSAAALTAEGARVPASAQAAHQQAVYLAKNLDQLLTGGATPGFNFRNNGALISLGSGQSVIGTLMGFVSGHNYRLQGTVAMLFYRWLYLRHRAVILGWMVAGLDAVGQSLARATRPHVKLH